MTAFCTAAGCYFAAMPSGQAPAFILPSADDDTLQRHADFTPMAAMATRHVRASFYAGPRQDIFRLMPKMGSRQEMSMHAGPLIFPGSSPPRDGDFLLFPCLLAITSRYAGDSR